MSSNRDLKFHFDKFYKDSNYRNNHYMTSTISLYDNTRTILFNNYKTLIINIIIFTKNYNNLYLDRDSGVNNRLNKSNIILFNTHFPIINIGFITYIDNLFEYLKIPLDIQIYDTNVKKAKDILSYISQNIIDTKLSSPLIDTIDKYILKNTNIFTNLVELHNKYLDAITKVHNSAHNLYDFINEMDKINTTDQAFIDLDTRQKNYKNCASIANEIIKEYKTLII